MTPFHILFADFRRLWAGVLLLIILIALSYALSITVRLEEQGLRVGSARAADSFDLVIGASGSETQLVLSTVFLQSSPLPLISMSYQDELSQNPLVQWSAPLAFGDFYQGFPIIGTTETMLTLGGERAILQGDAFISDQFEAVVGVHTQLNIGDKIVPMHSSAEHGDHHDAAYTVVGILPEQNNMWDRAILVPIDMIWNIHGMTHAHDHDEDEHEHEDEAEELLLEESHDHDHSSFLSASAILVKPKSIGGAYQLRAQYRNDHTLAVFPGEVLTKLYSTLGNIQMLLSIITLCTQVLMGLTIILLTMIYLSQRKREIAILRAFGAPRYAVFILVWSGLIIMVSLGLLTGLGIGFIVAKIIAYYISIESGLYLPIYLTQYDIKEMLFMIFIAAMILTIPALSIYRYSPVKALRE